MSKILGIVMHPVVVTIAALVLLSCVVYFGGQMLREKDFLSGAWSDTTLIVICISIWVLAGLVYSYRRYQARRRAQVIEARLRAQAQEQVASVRPDRQPEIAALEKQFDEALGALQASRLGKRALYTLPWYIIVGPPGSGKTTLLKESSLNFPHMGQGGRGVRGVGGTRNCDWWFTDQGILLDTAGRYTTEAEDHDEWISFLDMLRKARKHKPINGAMVAISIQDIVGASDEELVTHSSKIRDRLSELSKELDMVFPIYLVFTKCDLLDGFVETFGSMSREERSQVWGTTITPELRQGRDVPVVVEAETDTLYERLCANRLSLLAVDRPNARRRRIYSFPLQFMAVRDRVLEFTRLLSQPNPYYEGAELRGVYYTSGTQEGEPIDRVLSAMGEAFGFDPDVDKDSGVETTAKSYFIDNLFTDVVFKDKDLAHRSAKIQRRQQLIRRVALYGSAAAMLIALVMLFASYFGNRSAISATQTLLLDSKRLLPNVPFSEVAPTSEQIEVLARLNASFTELDRSHYLGSILLGRSGDLYGKVRTAYVRALKTFFLAPCQEHLRLYFVNRLDLDRADGKPPDPEAFKDFDSDSVPFAACIDLFEMLGGEPSKLGTDKKERLEKLFEEQRLWRWDPAARGKPRKTGVENPDELHFMTFLEIANGERSDWIVDPEPGALSAAHRFLANHVTSKQAVDGLIQDSAPADAKNAVGVDVGKFANDFEIKKVHTGSLKDGQKRAETFAKDINGDEKARKDARDEFAGEFVKVWRGVLKNYRPDSAEFRTLSGARQALPKYTRADKSPYVTIYNEVRKRLREARELTLPDAVDGTEVDAKKWLSTALGHIQRLDDDIGKYVTATTVPQGAGIDRPLGPVVSDITKNEGRSAKALLQAFQTARDKVGKLVQNHAELELRSEASTALKGLIGALEMAFAREAIVELEAYWSDAAKKLKGFGTHYPFRRDATTSVPMDDFVAVFKTGGLLDERLGPVVALAGMMVRDEPIVKLTPKFAPEARRLRKIQRALFADKADAAVVEFKLTLSPGTEPGDSQSYVGEILLFLSAARQISSKQRLTRKRQGGLPCKWSQADVGAKLQIVVLDSDNSILSQPVGVPPRSAGAKPSPWRFFRVVQSGNPGERGTGETLACEWKFDYQPEGHKKAMRRATGEITTTGGPNPFRAGFFEGFTFPTDVFVSPGAQQKGKKQEGNGK